MRRALLLAGGIAVAVTLAGASDDDCLTCHGGGALGEPRLDVSQTVLKRSVHGRAGLECVDCHQDLAEVEEFPHPAPAPVDCTTCHDDVAEAYHAGLHGKVGARGGKPPATCNACHGDHDIGLHPPGCRTCHSREAGAVARSVHGPRDGKGPPRARCWDCHGTHDAGSRPPDCASCHEKVARVYAGSLHGTLAAKGANLAPRCWTCHGSHDVARVDDAKAPVARYRIPQLCGTCHKEGTPVTRTYKIPQDRILQNYSQSIHGEGLLKQGLIVTAVCIDCHTSHNTLPHDDPRSSIYRDNISRTCEKCHARIEAVHQKVIRGELWEKSPNKVPVCVDCHQPHKVRRVFYEEVSDEECLACHGKPDLAVVRGGKRSSLFVDADELAGSVHHNRRCAQCHTGVTPGHDRPCDTVKGRVDCSICHEEEVAQYDDSIHGKLYGRGDPNAPSCLDCHDDHGTRSHRDPASPTFPTHVPDLCGKCHRRGEPAAVRYRGTDVEPVENYVDSAHGRGLLQSGLVVTAMCTDCHTAHHILPHDNPNSSISQKNVASTCGRCHNGIFEKYRNSIHSPTVSKSRKPLPTCKDCHTSHTIRRTDEAGFKLGIIDQCGKCHPDVTETYFETFHGKVSKLGFTGAARCDDCHGSHDILPPSDPASHLSRKNIVETCKKCHLGSHRRFAGYLTHATHHNREKYPILFYTFWLMTALLVGTFGFFGVHTLLWLPRSWQTMQTKRRLRRRESQELQYRRFPRLYRQLHFLVIVSFLGLAVTGMTLKFSYLEWAKWLSHLLGGFDSAGYIHRACAVITFTYFAIHIGDLIRRKRTEGKSWREFLSGANSMVPNRRDLRDMMGTLKWFVGLGPRPEYGRWTYWEKFDYFAVFWGVAVIGVTGLMLWFPELFTYLLPGWMINVATIIHSDEALLATGFIFTVHFFNTHFRPDAFPMDTVIFTGRVSLEELKADRPAEYRRLVESGRLERDLVEPLPPYVVKTFRVFGWVALTVGILLILLIIWAEVFGYR